MSSAAAAALAAVRARLETPDAGLVETLRDSLDLLQSPHPLDGAHAGSTMSFGLDALRAWAAFAKKAASCVQEADPLLQDPVWDVAAQRVHDALEVASPSATNRLCTVVDQLLHVWDTWSQTQPPVWARTLQSKQAGRVSPLIVQDLLLAHYGIDVLSESPTTFFARLLDDVQAGLGQVRRRSHLALTFMRVAPTNVEWLDVLATCLGKADERAREHLVAHIVQPLVEQSPSVLSKLLAALDQQGSAPAILAVLLVAKVQDLCVIEETATERVPVPLGVLDACLASAQPRLHVAALALCVEAKSPAVPLQANEAYGVRRFLADSLSLPSAVARQDTLAYLVKLLVRLRTSAKKGPDHQLLKHLYEAGVCAIHPGAPYPRTVLGVSLLLLLVEASATTRAPPCLYAESPLCESIRALHKAQQTFPSAPPPALRFSQAVVRRLVHLAAESTYEDIRRMSALTLVRLADDETSILREPAFLLEHVIQPSVERLAAPKEADAHAAVELLRLYHSVALPSMHAQILACISPGSYTGPWTAKLLAAHLARVHAQLDASPTLAQASQAGVHGSLAALTYLARAMPNVDGAPLTALVQRVWTLVSPVLCAAAPEGAEDVSEGERALAVADTHGDDPRAPISATSQQILSFAWRAIKEAAVLHTVCAQEAPLEANELFQTWLLQIRHRGAFSTVYPQYHALAQALCADPTTRALPSTWLHALLDRVDAHADSFSTTRRSAGLGYAVLALLSAHAAGAARAAETQRVVERLTRMARDAAPMRRIHGMNIWRVLVMDSTMAQAMRAYLGDALTLAVTSFSSPHWSVRNAAMMLFAAVSTRHLGVRAFEPTRRGPWIDSLLYASPALRPALLHTLTASAAHVGAADLAALGHGSALYAVLLLLSRTQPAAWPDVETLLAPLEQCARSAHAAVRSLAATCLARFVPAEQRTSLVERLWRDATTRDQNALAGTLAIIQALASPAYAPAVRARVDLLEGHVCAPTLAAFLQVAEACDAADAVRPFVERVLSTWEDQPVRDPFVVWLLPTLLASTWKHRVPVPRRLLHSDADMRTALVEFLAQAPSLPAALEAVHWPVEATQHDFVTLVLDAHAPLDARIYAANLISRLAAPLHGSADDLLTLLLATEHRPLSEALLPLVGRLYTPARQAACLRIWDACSHPEAPVSARYGVAQALGVMPKNDPQLRVLLLRLLQDDDADVRAAACALCPVPALMPEASYASVYALPRGPSACVEWVWQTSQGPAFSAHVWRLLTPACTDAEEAEGDELFPSEEANQYLDATADVLRAYKACRQGHVPPPPDLAERAKAAAWRLARPVPTEPHAYRTALQEALLVRLAQHTGQSEAVDGLAERFEALLVTEDEAPAAVLPRPLRVAYAVEH